MEQKWQIIPKLLVLDFGTNMHMYTYTHTHTSAQLCLSRFLCLGMLGTVICLIKSIHSLLTRYNGHSVKFPCLPQGDNQSINLSPSLFLSCAFPALGAYMYCVYMEYVRLNCNYSGMCCSSSPVLGDT